MNTNSLGQLWTSSMPFLYPFIIQFRYLLANLHSSNLFHRKITSKYYNKTTEIYSETFSLIAAGVTFVMGQNVGAERLRKQQLTYSGRKLNGSNNCNDNNNNKNCNNNCIKQDQYQNDERVDCNGISKGLFLGLLCLVVLTVVIIIFLVVKEDKDFPSHILSMLTFTVLFMILSLCLILNCFGLYQIRKLSYSGRKMSKLDTLLNMVSTIGVFMFSIFSLIVGANGFLSSELHSMEHHASLMLFIINGLQISQCATQSTFLGEAFQRQCLTRHLQLTKPGRQV